MSAARLVLLHLVRLAKAARSVSGTSWLAIAATADIELQINNCCAVVYWISALRASAAIRLGVMGLWASCLTLLARIAVNDYLV
jgi:hypothetical protein